MLTLSGRQIEGEGIISDIPSINDQPRVGTVVVYRVAGRNQRCTCQRWE